MNVFELKDSVKWTKQPEAWVVEQISDADEPRYYMELNRGSATQAVGTSQKTLSYSLKHKRLRCPLASSRTSLCFEPRSRRIT
jgi:hypothetical protein